MKCRDRKRQNEDDDKGDIGNFRASQCNEMPDENGGVDDEDAQEEIVVLRLQYKENNGEQRDDEKEFVDDLRAQFVFASLPQEMDDARERENDDEREGDERMQVLRNVNRRRQGESREFSEMVERCHVVGSVQEIAGHQPVGRNQSEQRGAERAEAECLQSDGHQQPEKGYEK